GRSGTPSPRTRLEESGFGRAGDAAQCVRAGPRRLCAAAELAALKGRFAFFDEGARRFLEVFAEVQTEALRVVAGLALHLVDEPAHDTDVGPNGQRRILEDLRGQRFGG